MNRRQFLASGCLAALSMFSVFSVAGCGQDRAVDRVQSSPLGPNDETTYKYTVPFGTGNKIDLGEPLDIMPQQLTVKVGESIRIVNDDVRDYMIGPFFVTAGQTLAMRFTHPGSLTGVCLVNPSGEFTITVTK